MTTAAEWEDPYADLVRTDDPSPGAARYYALDLVRGEMRRVGYEHLDDEDREAIAAWEKAGRARPAVQVRVRAAALAADPDSGEHPDFWRPAIACWLPDTPHRVFLSDSTQRCPTRDSALQAAAGRVQSLDDSP